MQRFFCQIVPAAALLLSSSDANYAFDDPKKEYLPEKGGLAIDMAATWKSSVPDDERLERFTHGSIDQIRQTHRQYSAKLPKPVRKTSLCSMWLTTNRHLA
ncbi:hypothetical protein CCR75_008320 [Bremia lactucae]|uniref:RxLR effector protein n=1 Tax=Bremia lactucae TaxID=4779 RepID=A0A976IDB0_BRELC|nr:hypothetical protein CCR75_008320 [Bremia lactucae]